MIRKEAILFGIVAWIILTLLFTEDKSATEGLVAIGFPWQFYRYTHGKLIYLGQSELGFNFSNLLLDLTLLIAFIYLVNSFLGRNLKKIKPDKPTYL
nr:hypothetical protein [uncultured Mucilaginibacter sp.]